MLRRSRLATAYSLASYSNQAYQGLVRSFLFLLSISGSHVKPYHQAGQQTLLELSNSLVSTKKMFTDQRATRVVMQYLSSYAAKEEELSKEEVSLVNNCLIFIRNILHVPAMNASHQNKIIWNLFSQNLDKTILDLISHPNSGAWCISTVELVALVYKDQHVVTLQTLLQNFLETNLSESSEDNESNTSNLNQPGSCSLSSETSSEQASQGTSSPVMVHSPHMVDSPRQRNSYRSIEVLPNNSPAPSPLAPMSLPEDEDVFQEEDEQEQFISTTYMAKDLKEENTSSGIDSELFSTVEDGSQPPPQKVFMFENEKGERVVVGLHTPELMGYTHKQRRRDKIIEPPSQPKLTGSTSTRKSTSSDNSDATGIPKKTKTPKCLMTENVSQQINKTMEQHDISSSSNGGDEQLKRPRTNAVKPRAQITSKLSDNDKKEKQCLKLLKRSRENRMRLKAMVDHIPSEKDISELLKEFTVDFLHNGYNKLVKEMLDQLSSKDCDKSMDKSYFLWLLTYFLKFASQLKVGLDQIGEVISFRVLSYLTYQGVELLETLEISSRERKSANPAHIRRMHLLVTALREFIQTIAIYKDIPTLTSSEKSHLQRLQIQTIYAKDTRQLLVLLLRSFNPQVQSTQYLRDLVVCNHMLLLDLESGCQNNTKGLKVNMTQHMAQFANPEMMRHYGRLLEEFQKNTPFLNDYIFTVMHHIAGDVKSPESLFLPTILKSFLTIWEQGLQIGDEWADLIKFIIQKFIQVMGRSPHTSVAAMVKCLDFTDVVDESGLTGLQTKQLFGHFTHVENKKDPVASLLKIYKRTENKSLSRLGMIHALLSHGVITHAQYKNFIYMKNNMHHGKREHGGSVKAEVGREPSYRTPKGHATDINGSVDTEQEKMTSELQVLKDRLVSHGHGALIPWVQEVLLDACRAKMYPEDLEPSNSTILQQPIPFYFNKGNQSIPLVPWNRSQCQGLQTEAFILMLHKLGLQLPADLGKVFPRIPHFWSADHTYSVAFKLGPIDISQLKFSLMELERLTTPSMAEDSGHGVMEQDVHDFDNSSNPLRSGP